MTAAKNPRVAYFCMEFGLDHRLPIYAGGLGVLAGDYLKAAKELDLPVVGIGILWRQDYTKQLIAEDGTPYDIYPIYHYDFIKDTGVTIKLHIRGAEVLCKVHLVDQYGNAPLYLLDTNFPGSEHGWMTAVLYGGVAQDRIAQEMILGIGGIRALRALGISIDKYHFNEGHAFFAATELLREKMDEQGMTFQEAWEKTKSEVVFTTHTPVEAGNEKHEHEVLRHMEAYNGLTYEQLNEIGGTPFNMTVAALRISYIANAVSKTHAKTARKMWEGVSGTKPIIAVTNGVHVSTWQDIRIRETYRIKGDIYQTHLEIKRDLINFIKQRTGAQLHTDSLIIGFARRAAPYKRSELIFRNAEVIEHLLLNGKLQLVFSGKAHPNDNFGKEIIKKLVNMDRRYGDSVVFLEDYNMEIAKLMVSGCDVWLNNPRRPLEASGTSGMKAALNGLLNVSVLDGWVGEGVVHQKTGWLLDKVFDEQVNEWDQDDYDLRALYKVILDEVIPTYYEKRQLWSSMMYDSITMSLEKFTAKRMITEYYQKMYHHVSDIKYNPAKDQILEKQFQSSQFH